MRSIRPSVSCAFGAHNADPAPETLPPALPLHDGRAWSSVDGLVVHGRTRTPSDPNLTPQPKEIDIEITKSLLGNRSFSIPRKPVPTQSHKRSASTVRPYRLFNRDFKVESTPCRQGSHETIQTLPIPIAKCSTTSHLQQSTIQTTKKAAKERSYKRLCDSIIQHNSLAIRCGLPRFEIPQEPVENSKNSRVTALWGKVKLSIHRLKDIEDERSVPHVLGLDVWTAHAGHCSISLPIEYQTYEGILVPTFLGTLIDFLVKNRKSISLYESLLSSNIYISRP